MQLACIKNDDLSSPLIELGKYLLSEDYRFVTTTPESHRRVLERSSTERTRPSENEILRDLLGWSKAVKASLVPPEVIQLLENAHALKFEGSYVRSAVRFSTFENKIFIHSKYPTKEEDSVFLGPDTYRFIRFIEDNISSAQTIVDLGCGTGAGGISLSLHLKKISGNETPLILGDINEVALNYAAINAKLNGVKQFTTVKSDLMTHIPRGADVVIANPPFIIDLTCPG